LLNIIWIDQAMMTCGSFATYVINITLRLMVLDNRLTT
jgi:hypothetical protein